MPRYPVRMIVFMARRSVRAYTKANDYSVFILFFFSPILLALFVRKLRGVSSPNLRYRAVRVFRVSGTDDYAIYFLRFLKTRFRQIRRTGREAFSRSFNNNKA